MNCSWTIFVFIISSWTVHELMMNCSWTFIYVNFSGTIDELFMNYFFSYQVLEQFMNCDGELFMNFSSWTNNASILWTFHELFMNVHECSWTVHKVMNYISPGWWCLETSPSEFRMMPWDIIWSPPDRHNGNGDIASSIPKLPYRLFC